MALATAPADTAALLRDAVSIAMDAANAEQELRMSRVKENARAEASPYGAAWMHLGRALMALTRDKIVRGAPDAVMLLYLLAFAAADAARAGRSIQVLKAVESALRRGQALAQHGPTREATEWCRSEWRSQNARYRFKTRFAEAYVPLVFERYRVTISERDLRERWLKGL